MSNIRELSQLASVITVSDGTKSVGIGSTQPSSKLSVAGDAYVSGVLTATSFIGDGSNLIGVSTFSGNYNDLTNTPTIPTNNNELTNGAGYITTSFTSTSQLTNDAGFITNNVSGVVTATSFSGDLTGDVTGNLTGNISGDTSISGNVTVTSTDAGSAAAPELILYRNSASPDDGDYLGQIQFKGKNDGGGDEIYAKVTGKISDASQGTEDGLIETAIKGGGSFTIVSRQRSDELQLLNGCGLSVAGDATISGNLTVNGTTTTIDTVVTSVDSMAVDGDVTAGGNLNVTGVATATTFNGNLTGNVTGNVTGDVTGNLNGLTYPSSDGSSNQVLKTDGNGSITFASVSSLSDFDWENDTDLGSIEDSATVTTDSGSIADPVSNDYNLKLIATDGVIYPDTFVLPSYTVSTLPSTNPAGGMLFVTDETGGSVPAFSDGTNWRRVTDRAIVS